MLNIKSLFFLIFTTTLVKIIYLIHFEGINSPFTSDSADYYRIAKYAAENGLASWSSYSRPPFLSFLIIPIIKIFSESLSIIIIKFLMILISVLSNITLYFFSLTISKNYKTALIVSLVYGLYPFSIFISSQLMTENPASLLILLTTFYFIKFIKNKKLKFIIFSAFFMGLLSLTRSSYYYMPFLFLLIIFFLKFPNLKKTLAIIYVFLTFYLTLSPWIIHNYYKLNEIVPTTNRLGYMLWLCNNDFSDEMIKRGGYSKNQKFLKEINNSKNLGPIESSNYLKNKAIAEIQLNKIKFIKAVFFRTINFFNPKPNPYKQMEWRDFISIVYFTPILALFFISLARNKYNNENSTLLCIIFYALITHLPFFGFPRFRFPVDSLIILISINYIIEKLRYNEQIIYLKKLYFNRIVQ